jgi:hypothetical protein
MPKESEEYPSTYRNPECVYRTSPPAGEVSWAPSAAGVSAPTGLSEPNAPTELSEPAEPTGLSEGAELGVVAGVDPGVVDPVVGDPGATVRSLRQ